MPSVIMCHHDVEGLFYTAYCTFIKPLIFNILPTLAILVLNSYLIFEIIYYYYKLSKNGVNSVVVRKIKNYKATCTYSESSDRLRTNTELSMYNLKAISKTQKSHYIVIMLVAIWAVLTSLPYYLLNTYLLFFNLELFDNRSNIVTIAIMQVITSIFFNSNHCFNFFIYLMFYRDFKCSFVKPPKKPLISNSNNASLRSMSAVKFNSKK